MFGVADNGEEWNTRTLRAHPTSGDHGETSKLTKGIFIRSLRRAAACRAGYCSFHLHICESQKTISSRRLRPGTPGSFCLASAAWSEQSWREPTG